MYSSTKVKKSNCYSFNEITNDERMYLNNLLKKVYKTNECWSNESTIEKELIWSIQWSLEMRYIPLSIDISLDE